MEEIKLNETETSNEPQQMILGRKLSIGVRMWSIFFIIMGIIWMFCFLYTLSKNIPMGVLSYLIPSMIMLICGVGLLKRKYGALVFLRWFLIIFGIGSFRVSFFPHLKSLFLNYSVLSQDAIGGEIGVLLFFFIMFLLPLCFLFKKSTVNQFRTHPEEINEGIGTDFTEKK